MSTTVEDFLRDSLGIVETPVLEEPSPSESEVWSPPPVPVEEPKPSTELIEKLGIEGELLEHNPKYEMILSELYEYANISHACRAAGVNRRTFYSWRVKDPEFDKACQAAYTAGITALEDAALVRAQKGYLEPVFHNGIECGVKRKFSDGLTQFLLEGALPEKYRKRIDAKVEQTGALNTLVIPATMDIQEWLNTHGS